MWPSVPAAGRPVSLRVVLEVGEAAPEPRRSSGSSCGGRGRGLFDLWSRASTGRSANDGSSDAGLGRRVELAAERAGCSPVVQRGEEGPAVIRLRFRSVVEFAFFSWLAVVSVDRLGVLLGLVVLAVVSVAALVAVELWSVTAGAYRETVRREAGRR